jgi:hypothetical protein
MIHLPKVLGLTICDRVEVDRESGHFSLIGLFQSRRIKDFPTPPQAFTVYAALFDGLGEGTLELVVAQLVTDLKVYRYRRWMTFPGRMLTVHMEIKIKQCIFPGPGGYAAVLRFDGDELSRRYLDIFRD